MPASELSADWGAQRVKDMSLVDAVSRRCSRSGSAGRRTRRTQVTSLIEEFNYPKYGPGQMWEIAHDEGDRRRARAASSSARSSSIRARRRRRLRGASRVDKDAGDEHVYPCTHVISSMPFGALLPAMDPPVARRRPRGRGRDCATATS